MSGLRTSLWAAVSAALLVCAGTPGGAQTPVPEPPATGVLPGGVAYALRPDRAQPVAVVALWFRAPAAGFEGPPVAGLSRLAAATVTASTPVTGTALAQLVERWGGRLAIAAYPDSAAVTLTVPADHALLAVRTLTADFFAPVTDQGGLKLAQRDAAEAALLRSFGPDAIEDALGAALFADGPLHDGTLASPQALASVTLARVRAYAERAFRPANAILVLTGDVGAGALGSVATRDGAAAGAETPAPQTARIATEPLRASGNFTGIGLGWAGPPITAEPEATALDFVADALFAPRTGRVTRALGTLKATVTGKFVTYRNPGIFLVTISGADAEAARPLVERVVADAAKPIGAAEFETERARFVYRTLADLTAPSDAADTYGWYAVEGDPAYAPAEGGAQGKYFTLAAHLTPASVAAAVATYLARPPAVVTMTKPSGKAE